MENKTYAADGRLNENEFQRMMAKLEQDNARQTKYARKQYRMAQISAVSCATALAVVLACVLLIVPKVNRTLSDTEQMMKNLDVITEELAESDLPGRISEIDIESLNEAIQDLNRIVGPLASLLGR